MKSHFNSFVNGLTNFSQNQILLAILGGVTSLSVFGVWQWNQEQHQKFITAQKAKCQEQLHSALSFVERNSLLYKRFLDKDGEISSLKQPGITTKFEKGKLYLLIYRNPHALIPDNPVYDDPFFEDLAKVADNAPSPLWVLGDSASNDKITVFSYCSPKSFEVSSQDLYESSQKVDYKFYSDEFWRKYQR